MHSHIHMNKARSTGDTMEINLRQAEVCAALGDVHRLLLVYAVADRPRNVTDLVNRIGLSQPAISRHLRILRECGIVQAERRGRSIYYCVADERLVPALDLLRGVVTDQLQKQGTAAASAAVRPNV
jgi:ArsR family transcriptional regulator